MRSLVDTIDEIIVIAPDLKQVLLSTRTSAMYAAPEMQPHWWRETANILNTYAVKHPASENIKRIFSGLL